MKANEKYNILSKAFPELIRNIDLIIQKAKIAKWILGISAAYFALSFIIQCSVQKTFEEHYPTEITQVVESKTIVEPLQIFLWRHVAKTDDGFYKGYYSIFDSDKNIDWQFIPRNKDLETTIQ